MCDYVLNGRILGHDECLFDFIIMIFIEYAQEYHFFKLIRFEETFCRFD